MSAAIRKLPLLTAVLASLWLGFGCAHDPEKLPPPRAYGDIDRSFDKRTITAERGDAVRINLPSTAGSGFTWRVVSNNSYVLRQIADPAFQADHPQLAGSSGTTTVVFQAINAGWSVVRLVNMRGDESTVTAENIFEVVVHVVPPKAPPKS
ncbi:MAG: protease inhibitor I42 family protein [Opitutaceae bacterium]|nr:protease inhibitor I42 family protein [Opitutaceae bacterium]